ncbi:cytochrome P450 [Karstenula rhodostoma CBS 690.94]|uniref:Cytochrome P450 n=1 Tax=Karstenula rhodostoma CBS 690.94 TaxID=1392251 RepID=A0A9P4UBM6_9PLEO|nr:cytochrome P450 [Karstenula rhodostoma CBS 690.94]
MALLTILPLGPKLSVWTFVFLLLAFVVYYSGWIIYTRTLHPLASIPGPLWPSISRTWLMWRMHVGDFEIELRKIHDQYGPLVRIAPDEVSSGVPAEIPDIYRMQKPLEKTVWYLPWRAVPQFDERPDMFTTLLGKDHAAYKKIIAGAFTMGSVLRNEDQMDECLRLFMNRMEEFADREESFDLGLWLEMYAFDIIGAVFFGKQFGFMENRHDHGKYIESVHLAMPFLSVLTMTPTYLRYFVMACAVAVPKLLKAVIAVDGIRAIAIQNTKEQMKAAEEATSKRHDILSQLLTIVHEKGEKVNFTEYNVMAEMHVGIMAGADSTSILLRSIFYYMMKNPETMAMATAEVDEAFAAGNLSWPPKHQEVVASCPYVCAIIKEASRVFPSFAVQIQRYSPPEGIKLSGKFIPAGYRVGMNPHIIQRDKEVFGQDADVFRPDRWLEGEERCKAMDRAYISFGVGTRPCAGKNLALAEIHKLVPAMLRTFSVEMAHNRPWKIHNASFIVQTDVICRLKRRK